MYISTCTSPEMSVFHSFQAEMPEKNLLKQIEIRLVIK